jgi:radical SAM enzyme (rSAM/lipoprotein system)
MDFFTTFKHLVFRQYRKNVIKRHTLDYLFWECTLKCNLDCLHCGSDCLKQSEIPDMPVEDFVKVLDDIKAHSLSENLFVCITGGEPLLRKDLETAGREIRRRGFRWGIVTNGVLLDWQRLQSLVNAGMSAVSFSLDGFEEAHLKLRRNPSAFQKTLSAIRLAAELSEKHLLNFDVITCVNRFNFNDLEKFRDFLISEKVRRWRIFSIFPEGRAKNNSEILALNQKEYISLMDFISETRKASEIHLNYSCEGFLGKYELKVRDYFYFCRAGINIASIMCDGGVTGCLSVRAKDFIQGSVYENSFSEIWLNGFGIMRERSWAKIGKCASCKVWDKCLGNGLHLHETLKSGASRCNYNELLN